MAPLLESRVDRPDHRKRQFRLAALGLLLVMPIAVAAYHYGMPAAVEWIALKVPVSWERRLGRSVVSTLAPENIRVSDRACTEPVNRILEMLTSRLPETPYTFHVTLVDQKMVNAFAAPGGHLVVFTGLINSAETPEELAGVLAHEIQHVEKRHATKAMLRELTGSLILGAVTGGTEGIGQILDTAGGLAGLTYRRQEEEEADREGMQLLKLARVDPNGMIRFFDSLEKSERVLSHIPSYVSTHPDTRSRIEDLRQLAGEVGYEPVALVTEEEWGALKEACGGRRGNCQFSVHPP